MFTSLITTILANIEGASKDINDTGLQKPELCDLILPFIKYYLDAATLYKSMLNEQNCDFSADFPRLQAPG